MAIYVNLKDKSGTSVPYENIDKIKVAGLNGSNEDCTHTFTRMNAIYAYSVTQQSGGGYLVNKKLEYIPNSDFLLFAIDETDFESFAYLVGDTKTAAFFLTTKVLTVGNVYEASDMY